MKQTHFKFFLVCFIHHIPQTVTVEANEGSMGHFEIHLIPLGVRSAKITNFEWSASTLFRVNLFR